MPVFHRIQTKLLVIAAFTSALPASILVWQQDWSLMLSSAVVLLAVTLILLLTHLLLQPINQGLQALESGLLNFKDGEFSTLLGYKGHDELGGLCQLYNETANKLRQEKQWIYQRELMLDKVLQSSPQALLLIDDSQHLVYSNQTARELFLKGQRLQGSLLKDILATAPEALGAALSHGKDGLFSFEVADNEVQTWHLSTGRFLLNNQYHHLYLFKHLTRELSRQEVAVWKKVIRVISHELNNSLAPISSMLHSGQVLAGKLDEPRLARVFNTIDDRIRHLSEFIQGYGRFAKLPTPQPVNIDWQELINTLKLQWSFQYLGELPQLNGYADRAQLEQLLINLLKNAHESGSKPENIEVRIDLSNEGQQRGHIISINDQGKGMSETVMSNALLPFYSTKSSGTGLGLALCREIAEAHQGKISFYNRTQGGVSVKVWLPLVS
ncbi:hypothetical protein PULV_a0956 [Pseudoalteromonas ulvae UL12]|uniref:sensor histidine kinase n=1 Tax=Pseudoalteromonas ulvae TaxID=107327 RepID=UPI00186B90AB|nr:ATP-binding protein [Pseudoalteromonas ulvae]MBE0363505.1 hypothetical protein [Pseudoalteromonas ulvae UL12]